VTGRIPRVPSAADPEPLPTTSVPVALTGRAAVACFFADELPPPDDSGVRLFSGLSGGVVKASGRPGRFAARRRLGAFSSCVFPVRVRLSVLRLSVAAGLVLTRKHEHRTCNRKRSSCHVDGFPLGLVPHTELIAVHDRLHTIDFARRHSSF